MSRMSDSATLSQIYTDHSIRLTGKNFTAKQIMPVTGHKLLNSLSIYEKVSTDKNCQCPMQWAATYRMKKNNPLIICQPVNMSND